MQKFSLNNIKSFKCSEEIEIKPITVFVGKNSSGKSSLIRFPVVLAQTFRDEAITPLLLFGNMIDYGNFDDVIYKHYSEEIGFKLVFGRELEHFIRADRDFRLLISIANRNCYIYNSKVEIRVYISKQERKIKVKRTELYFDEEKICTVCLEDKEFYKIMFHKLYNGCEWIEREIDFTGEKVHFNKFIPAIDAKELISKISLKRNMIKKGKSTVRDYHFFFSLNEYMDENIYKKSKSEFEKIYITIFLASLAYQSIYKQLKKESMETVYLGPFRINPQRTYRDSESNYNDVGVRGENTSMILRQAAQSDKTLLQDVSKWLYNAMGYSVVIQDIGSGVYSLAMSRDEETDNIMDVGYGITQVLPIVTQLFNLNANYYADGGYSMQLSKRKTVIIEQPEIHLHPAAQAELADLFVECVSDKKIGVNRILIETHSEHLIRKLQVLVADPEVNISNDQIAIYYVDKNKSGDSTIEKMELSESGQFEKAWPSGFFDKSYELTKLLLQANIKERRQDK